MPKTKSSSISIEAIDLFCGIGGLTFGLRTSGIKVLAGLDFDESCRTPYEKNNKAQFIAADISTYDFEEMKSMYSKNSIKVLVGCAPCQPFSSHTYKARGKTTDARWNLIEHFIRAVETLEPDIVSMENVRGICETDVFKKFLSDLESLNYEVDYDVLYCPKYGIPQNRSRMVLLASKIGKIAIPSPTHAKENYVTVKDVIGQLPALKSGEIHSRDSIHRAKNLSTINIERIKQSKPNGTWRDWDKKLLPPCYKKESGSTYTSVYGRMGWDGIAPTITTQFYNYGSGRFGHPKQNRGLSIREGALLQTFPLNYNFGDKIPLSVLGRQIGNAVPPKLGEVIGEAITNHIRQRV